MLINYALFSKEFANIRILIQIGNKELKNIFWRSGGRLMVLIPVISSKSINQPIILNIAKYLVDYALSNFV